MLLGVLADTHGQLAPRALSALQGVERILHAGDIGDAAIITTLERVAPVTAVRGNSDAGTPLHRSYPESRWLEFEGQRIYLTHIGGAPQELARALPREAALRPAVYIFGHTHRPLIETIDGVVFLNPGAAGQARHGAGLSLALLDIRPGDIVARIVKL